MLTPIAHLSRLEIAFAAASLAGVIRSGLLILLVTCAAVWTVLSAMAVAFRFSLGNGLRQK